MNKQQIFEDYEGYAKATSGSSVKFSSSMCACEPDDEEYESSNDEGIYEQSPEY